MAVSQQWFIQWSAPSMIFGDITSKYNNVNNWNNFNRQISDSETVRNEDDYNYLKSEHVRDQLYFNNHKDATNKRLNGKLHKAL